MALKSLPKLDGKVCITYGDRQYVMAGRQWVDFRLNAENPVPTMLNCEEHYGDRDGYIIAEVTLDEKNAYLSDDYILGTTVAEMPN